MTDSSADKLPPSVPSRQRGKPAEVAPVIGACLFILANLLIVVSAMPFGDRPAREFPLMGVVYQGAVLAIWIGAGRSPLWVRGLTFAFSYFYFRFYFQDDFVPSVDMACPPGMMVLMIAAGSAALRLAMHGTSPRSSWRHFSLHQMLGLVTAIALVLAVWGKPMIDYVRISSQSAGSRSLAGVLWRDLVLAAGVLVVALPTFFRSRVWRWRAYFASLILLVVGIGLLGLYENGLRAFRYAIAYMPPVILVSFAASYLFFAAESAFELVGVEFARPLPESAGGEDEGEALSEEEV